MTLDMPLTVDEITDEWLTHRLRDAGHDAWVRSHVREAIGHGQLGATYRLHLELDASAGSDRENGVPRSLVLKQASAGERSRRVGAEGYGFDGRPGFFAQEVAFYEGYAAELSIDTPACLFAGISEDGADFTLLLEDVSPARPGDEFVVSDVGSIRTAVREMAGLHAPQWGSPHTRPEHGLHAPTSDEAAVFADRLRRNVAVLDGRGLLDVGVDERRLVDLLVDHAEAWFTGLGHPPTLVHGDFRMDNLLLPAGPSRQRVVTVDWQTFSTSYAYRDLGQLLGASISTELRRAHHDDLLGAYSDRARELGADIDSVEELLRVGVLHPVHSAIALLRGGYADGRGRRLAETWLRRSAATAHDLDTWSAFS